jgi:K+/H+ antiporter YhaU regulatory subunit KhtT
MFHDVLILLGVFAWLGKTIDGVFLASLLTVIGYSVNDSVVVFDRIREQRSLRAKEPLSVVANQACLQTIPRTINTGLGALFILVVLYLFGGETHADEAACAVELTDDQARRIGAILGGAFFKPAVVEEIEDIVGEFVVDWVTLPEDADAVGRSISELQIRRRTGFSVVAIVRGKRTITAPDPDEVLRPGDRLVVVGRHADLPRFVDLITG